MWWKVSNVWNFEFLNYVFLRFFERRFKKRKKSRFLDFQKKRKNVFSNYAWKYWTTNTGSQCRRTPKSPPKVKCKMQANYQFIPGQVVAAHRYGLQPATGQENPAHKSDTFSVPSLNYFNSCWLYVRPLSSLWSGNPPVKPHHNYNKT